MLVKPAIKCSVATGYLNCETSYLDPWGGGGSRCSENSHLPDLLRDKIVKCIHHTSSRKQVLKAAEELFVNKH